MSGAKYQPSKFVHRGKLLQRRRAMVNMTPVDKHFPPKEIVALADAEAQYPDMEQSKVNNKVLSRFHAWMTADEVLGYAGNNRSVATLMVEGRPKVRRNDGVSF